MKLEEIYTALAAIENGAAITDALKAEINRLRNEAAGHRTKLQKVTTELGLKDAENIDEAVAGLKASLDAIAKTGGKPDEIGAQIAQLTKQVQQLTQQSEADKKAAQTEREKRISAIRSAKTVEALTAAKAIKPAELAKLLAEAVQIKDDDSIVYKDGDKELPLADGIAAYLKANPEFVANAAAPGSGGGGPGAGGAPDLEKMTMSEYAAYRQKQMQGG